MVNDVIKLIKNHIQFKFQCIRNLTENFPSDRGEKSGKAKCFSGSSLILIIIVLIWSPLALFTFSGSIGNSNIPVQVAVSVSFDDYNPIYEMTARKDNTFVFTDKDRAILLSAYSNNKGAINLIKSVQPEDFIAASLFINSKTLWITSPPDKEQLLLDLSSGKNNFF